MNVSELSERVNALIALLGGELSDADRSCGWTEESRDAMRVFFEKFRADILSGKDLREKPEYASVARGLDHWGISSGGLFEAAVAVANFVIKWQ
jgi:hypothetical protein